MNIQLKSVPWRHLASAFLFIGTLFFTLNNRIRDVFLLLAVIAALPNLNWTTLKTLCRNHRWVQVCIALFCVVAAGTLYGNAPVGRAVDILWKYRRLLYPLALLPLFNNHVIARSAYRYGLYLSCLAIFFVAIYNTYFSGHLGDGTYSPFVNSIYTGLIMSLAATVALAAIAGKSSNAHDLILLGISTLYFVFICQSRTGTFAYLAACGIIGLTWSFQHGFRLKQWFISLSAIGLITALFLPANLPARTRLLQAIDELRHYHAHDLTQSISTTSFGARLDFLHISYHLSLEKPWLGSGTGGLAAEFAARGYRSVDGNPSNLTHNVANPHNQYALTLVEHGYVGLFILFAWLITYLKPWPIWPTPTHRYAAYGVFACVVIACLSDSVLMIGATADVIVVTSCLILCNFTPKRTAK